MSVSSCLSVKEQKRLKRYYDSGAKNIEKCACDGGYYFWSWSSRGWKVPPLRNKTCDVCNKNGRSND